MVNLKKNDYFLDVSSYQPANLAAMTAAAGTDKTIIKISEATNYLSPYRQAQADTSTAIGYYHFARFGGSAAVALAEAEHMLRNLPNKKVKYIVCDYEDSASASKLANTNAIIVFMDRVAQAGYKPIYYSYRPYTMQYVNYQSIIAKYPNSLWIAAYPNYNVTPDPVWSIFPSLDGIRWWQFTSTAIAGGLDKNVVLMADDDKDAAAEAAETILNLTLGGKLMYTVGAKNRGIGLVDGGAFFGLQKATDPVKYWEAGVKHINVSTETFDVLQAKATNALLDKVVANTKK